MRYTTSRLNRLLGDHIGVHIASLMSERNRIELLGIRELINKTSFDILLSKKYIGIHFESDDLRLFLVVAGATMLFKSLVFLIVLKNKRDLYGEPFFFNYI